MDWNRDGKVDILTGCYWTEDADAGYIQMLAGNGNLDFAEAVSIKNSSGEPLENVELNKSGENAAMADNQTSNICTQQHAVDYDGDGDLDLVVGCFGSEFFLHTNTGSNENITFSDKPVPLTIKSTSYHSAPHLVDWDGDGDLDLLSGTADGGAIISENTGTRQKPEWSDFEQLIASSDKMEQSTYLGDSIEPGKSTRVWSTDWNGDGLLDLLVGDSTTIVNPKEGIETEEYDKRLSEYKQAMAAVQKKQMDLTPKYQAAMEAGEKIDDELQKQMRENSKEMSKLYNSKRQFQESKSTGFVWLYIRKPVHQPTDTPAGKPDIH